MKEGRVSWSSRRDSELPPVSPRVEAFLRFREDAPSAASLQRAQLCFDSVATPLERSELLSRVAPASSLRATWISVLIKLGGKAQRPRAPWSRRLARWLVKKDWELTCRKHATYSISPTAQYRRVFKRGSYALYQASENRSQALVVVFTGQMFRVGMPLPVFLQAAAYKNLDVVVVWPDRSTRSYSGVLPGLGQALLPSIKVLERQLHGYDLRGSHIIATSAGTIPGLVAAKLWGVRSIVAAGTVHHAEKTLQTISIPSDFDNCVTRYLFVFGEHANGRDAEVAGRLAGLTRGSTEMIIGAPHVPLFPLVQRGEFSGWLDTRLFGD